MAPRPPLVTDEFPDRWFGRPLARFVARALLPTPLTPNQVTAIATVAGCLGGWALWLGEGGWFAASVAAYLVLDCADGQLARLRGGGTIWGRVVDGIGDYLTAIAAHLGLVAWLARDLGLLAALAWGAAAAGSLAWASFLLDRYKRRYRGDQDDLDAVRREVEAAGGAKRIFLRGFLPYAGAAVGGSPIPDRAAYQDRVRLPMRLFLLAGPTTHMVVFAVLAALGQPLGYAIAAVGPFNLLALTALFLQVGLERRAPPVVAGTESISEAP